MFLTTIDAKNIFKIFPRILGKFVARFLLKTIFHALFRTSVADSERFDVVPDPDPTFKADADPNPNPFTRVKKFFFKSSTIVSKVSQNLS